MLMDSGRFTRRITISRATLTNGPIGVTEVWADIGAAWSMRTDVSDAEKIAAGTVQSSTVARFVVRVSEFSSSIRPMDRIADRGRVFEITGIKESFGKPCLEITAEARTDP